MNPEKEAENTPEEEREEKAAEYLLKSAQNQKKAAKKIKSTLEDAKNTFNTALDSVKGEDYNKLAQTINQVNSLLREAKNGGDIDNIVSKLKSLKNAR